MGRSSWFFLVWAFSSPLFGVTPEERLSYFCPTYEACRAQFLKAADGLVKKLPAGEAASVQRGYWKVPSKVDQNLVTDWLFLPAKKQPKRLVLVTSATHGVEGKFKRSGPTDLYIVPLANALQSWRERDRQVRLATGKDPSASEAIIIADSTIPYRLFIEVLFTLGQNEFGKYHLMVMQAK